MMIKKIKLLSILFCYALGFSQNLRPVAQKISEFHTQNKTFIKYDLFELNKTSKKLTEYKRAATDITVLSLNTEALKKVVESKPEFIEVSFPFEGDKEIIVELYKNQIFTNDFKIKTKKGQTVNYTPGVYYRGVVKGDINSVVAVSFFNNDFVGIISSPVFGNVNVGKVKSSEDFVIYSESKLTRKNPFICGVDQLKKNKSQIKTFDPTLNKNTLTTNCVRIYYEICYQSYQDNGSNTTNVTNWMTAIHNNVSTLYNNDNIKVALSEIYIWTTPDPYTSDPETNLYDFSNNRKGFNGDVAYFVDSPTDSGFAYLNSLCSSTPYAYGGVSQTYNNVPVFSWTLHVITHELGHAFGSPHTHACAWNGNNTAIDGCGAQAGYNEGCDGPIPPTGGTMMSYCYLTSVGNNFSNGFGPQPAALIRNTIDSKICLGTDCVTSCVPSVIDVNFTNITETSVTATITDDISNSWIYELVNNDGTTVTTGTTNSKILNFTGLIPASYYRLYVKNNCVGSVNRYGLFLTEANWCSGAQFTDTGGATENYSSDVPLIKTFYPSPGSKLTMTFTEFDLFAGNDFMNIFNGTSVNSPLFSNGTNLTGNTLPGSFTSTDSSGAITVKFTSNSPGAIGWIANFSCSGVLGVSDSNTKDNSVDIYPNPAKNMITISAKDNLKSYKIYDEAGRLIKSATSLKGNKIEINLSSIQTGNYVISVETEKQSITKKLIKQ